MAVVLYGLFGKKSTEDAVVFTGVMKVVISFVKYLPQVYLNFKRKRTDGWSLENVMLDFAGGALSFIQIFVDWEIAGTTTQFSGGLNVAKFLLSIVCMVFDLVFLFQHYVLYHPSTYLENHDKTAYPGEYDSPLVDGKPQTALTD